MLIGTSTAFAGVIPDRQFKTCVEPAIVYSPKTDYVSNATFLNDGGWHFDFSRLHFTGAQSDCHRWIMAFGAGDLSLTTSDLTHLAIRKAKMLIETGQVPGLTPQRFAKFQNGGKDCRSKQNTMVSLFAPPKIGFEVTGKDGKVVDTVTSGLASSSGCH